MKAAVGDTIVIGGHRVGEQRRVGTIVDVVGEDGQPPYRIRWSGSDDVHLVVPGSDAVVERAED